MKELEAMVSSLVDGHAVVRVEVPDSESRAEVLWRAAARLCREAGELEASAGAGQSPASREAFVAARYSMLQSRGDVVREPDVAEAEEACVQCGGDNLPFVLRDGARTCTRCATQQVPA